MSNNQALEQFKEAIYDALGYAPVDVIGDGAIHHFKNEQGKLNGAYRLYTDNRPAGWFQCHKMGILQKWTLSGGYVPISSMKQLLNQAKYRQEAKDRQQAELTKQAAVAVVATEIWNQAPLAPANYLYLVTKKIGINGARVGRSNALIVPLYNANKEIVSLQFISETGGKTFLSGGKKKGCFYELGEQTDKILICEGFATGASLYENSGYLVVIAFDAGNLKAVAINIRSIYPMSEIIICGDNDLSGVGQSKAIDAASIIGGKYLIPEIVGQDWNDILSGGVYE
ncbi:MAG: toprim domain-containing protein [Methylococcaceae bacterium]